MTATPGSGPRRWWTRRTRRTTPRPGLPPWLAWIPRLSRRIRGRPRRLAAVLALAALALVLSRCPFAERADSGRTRWPREEILQALRFVESGGHDDVADGDQGAAIGPYQIHQRYWQDAVTATPALGGGYQDCRRRRYAEQVIAAYMRKWATDAWDNGDAQTIARIHNGGPEGARRSATLPYWRRVRARLPD